MTKNGDKFVIEGLGGRRTISGEIKVGGAKNAILKILASSILFQDGFEAKNVPEIEDVFRMFDLLGDLGVNIKRIGHGHYNIDTQSIENKSLWPEIAMKMRSSIVLTGPLLSRFGRVDFPYPGGCVIGRRPVDLFLSAYEKMGATVSITKEGDRDIFSIEAPGGKLRGAEIFFKTQSVTVTETLMLAAVLAEGNTALKNCALEPEIESLGNFLNECGARITGLGTPTILIEGGELLSGKGKIYQTMPDRIEAGSFLILGALAAKELKILRCEPKHLDALIHVLRESGVSIETGENYIVVRNDNGGIFKATDIKTREYPGFPTDLQAPLAIFLSQAEGQSFIFETVFEGRLNYLNELEGKKGFIFNNYCIWMFGI